MSQLELGLRDPRRWGGRRAGAGRKRSGDRARVTHATRPGFHTPCPMHVTLRVRPDVPSLRARSFVREFERRMAHGCERGNFRLVHYSLQSNHAHLVIEASHRTALARGMTALCSRFARAVNRVFHRRGPVLDDRYHARALRSPREVRNVLQYVLLNARRHAFDRARVVGLDPHSSARFFDGWRRGEEPDRQSWDTSDPPVARARTWLLAVGWRRHGPIDPMDVPGSG